MQPFDGDNGILLLRSWVVLENDRVCSEMVNFRRQLLHIEPIAPPFCAMANKWPPLDLDHEAMAQIINDTLYMTELLDSFRTLDQAIRVRVQKRLSENLPNPQCPFPNRQMLTTINGVQYFYSNYSLSMAQISFPRAPLCCWSSLIRELRPRSSFHRSLATIQRGKPQKLDLPPNLPESYWSQLPKTLRPDYG